MIAIYFDGACEPVNPGGHMGWGIAVLEDNAVIHTESGYEPAGSQTSNNVAEYLGAIMALKWAIAAHHEGKPSLVPIWGDSKLVIEQLKGKWQVRNGGHYVRHMHEAKRLIAQASALGLGFTWNWLPGRENVHADVASRRELYHPPDVNLCHKEWRATCGPCSLAAAVGCPVADVFEAVSEPPPPDELPGISPRRFRGFMTITHMRAALDQLGMRVVRSLTEEWWRKPGVQPESRLEDWLRDATAIACLRWGGPWDDVPRAAARYRHFIATRFCAADDDGPQIWVYDWNATSSVSNDGAWTPWSWWEAKVLPGLLPESGDGTFRIQWAGAITRRARREQPQRRSG